MKSFFAFLRGGSVAGCCLAALTLSLIADPASGQTPSGANRLRSAQNSRPQPRSELRHANALKKAVREELGLSQDQAKIIGGLFDDYIEQVKDLARQAEKDREKNRERIGSLRREMMAARKDGNMERLREVRTELRELNSGELRLRRARKEFDEKILAELNEEQATIYKRLTSRIRRRSAPDFAALRSLGRTRQILRRLDLSEEQNAKVRELMQSLGKSLAGSDGDRDAAIAGFRTKALEVLNDEQRARFQELETDLAKAKDNAPRLRPSATKPQSRD